MQNRRDGNGAVEMFRDGMLIRCSSYAKDDAMCFGVRPFLLTKTGLQKVVFSSKNIC